MWSRPELRGKTTTLRLVAPPGLVIAHASHQVSPGPPLPGIMPGATPLDGLIVDILPRRDGSLMACIIRPAPGVTAGPYLAWLKNGNISGPRIWQGPLSDIDGVRLTVRDNQGVLAGRAGDTLWAGQVQDLPSPNALPVDGTITVHLSPAKATLRAGNGRLLWSVPTTVLTTTATGLPRQESLWDPTPISQLGVQTCLPAAHSP